MAVAEPFPWGAIKLIVNPMVPMGAVFMSADPFGGAPMVITSPYDRYGYPTMFAPKVPLYTRCTLGGREAARDVRRRARLNGRPRPRRR